jgi:hypothetical protein
LLHVERLLLPVDHLGLSIRSAALVNLLVLIGNVDAAGVLRPDLERLAIGRDDRRLSGRGQGRAAADEQGAADAERAEPEHEANRDEALAGPPALDRVEVVERIRIGRIFDLVVRVRIRGGIGRVAECGLGALGLLPERLLEGLLGRCVRRIGAIRGSPGGLVRVFVRLRPPRRGPLAGENRAERVVLPDDAGELRQGIVLGR